jgi:hypothetical protein
MSQMVTGKASLLVLPYLVVLENWYIFRLCFLHESKNLNSYFCFFSIQDQDPARSFISDRVLFISRRSRQNRK